MTDEYFYGKPLSSLNFAHTDVIIYILALAFHVKICIWNKRQKRPLNTRLAILFR